MYESHLGRMDRHLSGAADGYLHRRSVLRSDISRPRKVRQLQICRASGKQQKSLIEPSAATKVRVERQTHLPASREEAWGALKQLAPERAWKELSPVLAALESIYRQEPSSGAPQGSIGWTCLLS